MPLEPQRVDVFYRQEDPVEHVAPEGEPWPPEVEGWVWTGPLEVIKSRCRHPHIHDI